jgi:hypothetical protein
MTEKTATVFANQLSHRRIRAGCSSIACFRRPPDGWAQALSVARALGFHAVGGRRRGSSRRPLNTMYTRHLTRSPRKVETTTKPTTGITEGDGQPDRLLHAKKLPIFAKLGATVLHQEAGIHGAQFGQVVAQMQAQASAAAGGSYWLRRGSGIIPSISPRVLRSSAVRRSAAAAVRLFRNRGR